MLIAPLIDPDNVENFNRSILDIWKAKGVFGYSNTPYSGSSS